VADPDRETRDRLLDVAARLFAGHGFNDVTVRDICQQAEANVAAVNYHFNGKLGLYEEVLRRAIRIMQATTEEIRKAGANQPPEGQLEAAIRVFLTRVATTRNKWIHQLMFQEVSNPTPSFDLVLNEVITPRMAYIRGAVAGIMGREPDDPRVSLCVMSIQAQMFALLKSPMAMRLGQPQLTPEHAGQLARHIARFSIGGIHAVDSSNDPAT
jgi:TetR/AcrR family transcriptional regulator, regulator of cefoperazone and chloramphenicol sensitivity